MGPHCFKLSPRRQPYEQAARQQAWGPCSDSMRTRFHYLDALHVNELQVVVIVTAMGEQLLEEGNELRGARRNILFVGL